MDQDKKSFFFLVGYYVLGFWGVVQLAGCLVVTQEVGGSSPPAPAYYKGEHMAEHKLDDMVEAIQTAIMSATDIAERHELDSLQKEEFWYKELHKDGTPVKDQDGNEVYRPRMVTLRIPQWVDGKLEEHDVPVPLQTLTTGQSLQMHRLEVEMEVEVCGLEEKSGSDCGLMVRPSGGGSMFNHKKNTAKLKLVFKGSDPPEGYARVDDQLIKLLP